MRQELYAHSKSDENNEPLPTSEWQTLYSHSTQTAELAKSFSVAFLKQIAYNTGLLHDLGKATKEFQAYLKGKHPRTEHAFCGAQYLFEKSDGKLSPDLLAMAYVVAGHHSGLPDYGARTDGEDEPSLIGKLRRRGGEYSFFADELQLSKETSFIRFLRESISSDSDNKKIKHRLCEKFTFAVRYLFSVLTDADFLDTESFVKGARKVFECDFERAEEKLDNKLRSFSLDTPVKRSRAALQSQALSNLRSEQRIHLLNMPTGSGKTLLSLKLALKLRREKNVKRIIYVIPYTSIIEQTAEEFANYFSEEEILSITAISIMILYAGTSRAEANTT